MRSNQGPLERLCPLQRRVFVQALGLAATVGLPMATAQAAAVHSEGAAASRWFHSSDGVRLHYLEAGAAHAASGGAPTLVFVPGWTMPAWIWQAQIEHFAPRFRVLAFDPRGQGQSAIAKTGYDHVRRAADIAELLAAAGTGTNVVLVGWSLGVLEALQFVHDARQAGTTTAPLRGLVLVDNSVGVGDPPAGDPSFFTRLRTKRRATVSGFVTAMFKRPREPRWLAELTNAALHTPLQASIDLLRQPRPREFWRDALLATREPMLYLYTPRFAQQGEIVRAHLPGNLETHLFAEAGHALFVDEAAAFNEILERFVLRSGAPAVVPSAASSSPPRAPTAQEKPK